MEKQTEKEVAVRKETAMTPAQAILSAVKAGTDLEQLKGVLALQFEWEANEARKAFHQAMAEFKANPPEILKDKSVSYATSKGTTAYKHATLHNVTKSINEALSRHDLSASWQTAQNGSISVTCKITHALGHSEETTLSAQADATGSKNSIQAMGSTITYLERYTLLALTGLSTGDQDDDGKLAEIQVDEDYLDEKQLGVIRDYVDNFKVFDEAKFLENAKAESIETIAKSEYNRIVIMLESKKQTEEGGSKC